MITTQNPSETETPETAYVPEHLSFVERLLGPMAISLSLMAIFMGALFFMVTVIFPTETIVIHTTPPDEVVEKVKEDPPIDIDVTKTTTETDKKDITLIEVPLHEERNETPNDELFKEAKGDEGISPVDFPVSAHPALVMGFGDSGGKPYGGRRGGKERLVQQGGGNYGTVKAVTSALDWLARHQHPKGYWSLEGYTRQCGRDGHKGRCDGCGDLSYDVGGTALAVLAFTGDGVDHRTPHLKGWDKVVAKGVSFLMGLQSSDGAFGEEKGNFLYNQTLATLALADLLVLSGDEKLRPAVEKGIKHILAAQNPGLGWRYHNYKTHPERKQDADVNGDLNDTSVTTWAVMALKTAKVAGIAVDPQGFSGADAWLDHVYDSKGYNQPGTFGYTKKGGFVDRLPFATTACGMLSRQFMHQASGVGPGAETLLQQLPDWEGPHRNMYYWYYGSLAMFQVGGEAWGSWNGAMKKALLKGQHRPVSGCLAGSWDPHGDRWGDFGGRVYTTAIGALTLEVYYRYTKEKMSDQAVSDE